MALVPSGRWRLMVAQTMANDPAHMGTGQAAAPAGSPPLQSRNNVQQQEIGDQPVDQQQGVGEEGMPAENFEGGEGADMSIQPVEQQQEQAVEPETTLKAYVFKVVEQLGVPPRMLQNMPDVFSQVIDFDTHTVSGHYYLPTHTKNKEVDEQMAIQVAQRIGSQFGLSQKMSLEHKDGAANWKVTFNTQPKAQIQQSGTSFDVLKQHNSGGGGSGGGQQMARAAFTIGELIKARKDDLYEAMRKIAKGN